MSPTEKKLADDIATYLAARGDRLATDLGLLEFRLVGDVLRANVGGVVFKIAIVVTAVANDNAKGGR